jgi:hypothetical protein
MKRFFLKYSTGGRHSSNSKINVNENINTVTNPLKFKKGGLKILKKPIYYSGMLSCLIAIILFFITGWKMQGQEYIEFAPIGAEWYYSYTFTDPLESCNKYRVEKDTIIEGTLCKMVIHSFCNDNRNLDTIIFKQDGGKIYYYFNEQFNLIYAYDVQISDEVVFTFKCYIEEDSVSLIPVRCIVNDIQQIEINGRQYKQFFTTIDTSFDDRWFHVSGSNYEYVEQIGHFHVFMEELTSIIDMAQYTIELRCYTEDAFHYITPWWQQYGDLPCNYWGGTDINKPNLIDSLSVFPNPVQNELYFVYYGSQSSVSGEILSPTGQSLMRFNTDNQTQSVNISQLSSGIYFLKYQIDNTSIIHKIIKQ